MNKSIKLYNMALEKYNNGEMGKSLQLCNECISLNLKNAAALNLKGLILYLKGNLSGAENIWKINFCQNKDTVSKNYLESLEKDKIKEQIYKSAEKYISSFEIDKALTILLECEKSDFNFINVHNALTKCYMAKGEYSKAIKHINTVLNIDKKNIIALKNKNKLTDIGVIKSNKKSLNIIFFIVVILIIISALITSVYIYKDKLHFMSNKENKPLKILDKKDVVNKNNLSKKAECKNKLATENKEINNFPYDNLKLAMDNENFNEIYKYLNKYKDKKLKLSDKILLQKSKKLMKENGVKYFYTEGTNFINNSKYKMAREYLLKAMDYGSESYLQQHIIYMLGVVNEKLEDNENEIKYLVLYDKNYSKGSYEDTVLYKLAMLYKDVDLDTSKKYASKLRDNYSNSVYNNVNIKSILGE